MKSGMEAAKVIAANINGENKSLDAEIKNSWLYTELYKSTNCGPFFHKFGGMIGGDIIND